jgi:phosphoribosylformimino-5-aminoimidazole carboxamide ribotide isomerase
MVSMTGSSFEILPAIDLRGGRVVRLRQGEFDRETAYAVDPVAMATAFAEAGAGWLHVVDLDAARTGSPAAGAAIRAILGAVGDRVAVEVAGGLRSDDAVATALGAGASRVVVGTAAVRDPAFAWRVVRDYGAARVAVALDVRDGRAVGDGWQDGQAGVEIGELLGRLADEGVETFEVTSIARDGLLGGPDLELLRAAVELGRGRIIASAGIASLDDLRALRDIGCVGAIVGRALYEDRIDLREAVLQLARE